MKKILLIILAMLIIPMVYGECDNLTTDITISIDSEPYLEKKINFLAVLPTEYKNHVIKCWSYVEREGNIQQLNPQKQEYSRTFFSLAKRVEDREYFSSERGVVNAYFTNKNIVAYTNFTLVLSCVSENTGDTIIGEKCITPVYNDLKQVPARGVWFVQNSETLVVLGVFILVCLIVLVMFKDAIFGK